MHAHRLTPGRTPMVGVFDAGIGGLPFAAALRRSRPDVAIVYLADSARRPYGPQPQSAIRRYMSEVSAFFDECQCDVWVVACNTASVAVNNVAPGRSVRIDMVQAVRHAAAKAPSRSVGLLGTAGTVGSGVMVEALSGYTVTQLATEELLRHAEEGSTDYDTIRRLSCEALTHLRQAGCDSAVLACTDYTAILPLMSEVAGGLTLIDPLDAAVELTVTHLAPELPSSSASPVRKDRLCLTGPHPVDVRHYACHDLGLPLPQAETITLPTVENDCVTATLGGDS